MLDAYILNTFILSYPTPLIIIVLSIYPSIVHDARTRTRLKSRSFFISRQSPMHNTRLVLLASIYVSFYSIYIYVQKHQHALDTTHYMHEKYIHNQAACYIYTHMLCQEPTLLISQQFSAVLSTHPRHAWSRRIVRAPSAQSHCRK